MKIIKLALATAFVTGCMTLSFVDSADALIKRKTKSSGDSNTGKSLTFEFNNSQPGVISNINLKNSEDPTLIETGTTPGQVFGIDNEATVSIYSRQNIEEDTFLGETYSQIITFDVDELSFSNYPNGELTLYWLVPKTINPSTISNLSDLLNFSEEDIKNSLNAVLEKDRTSDIYQLDPNEGEFSSGFFPFEGDAEPWGAQLNNFRFNMNITEEPRTEKIPEPNVTISLLCLTGGVLGIKLLQKRKMK